MRRIVPIVLLAAACTGEPLENSPEFDVLATGVATADPEIRGQLAQLRAATAEYQRFAAAEQAGYTTRITECMEEPQGGMGYHYGNVDLIDDVVEPLRPEVLMYEPGPNGSMRLVGVEYVVPLAAWSGATPPVLFGQEFQRNEVFQIWALHAWIYKANPAGVFAPWNPLVSCRYAAD